MKSNQQIAVGAMIDTSKGGMSTNMGRNGGEDYEMIVSNDDDLNISG